ncbi:MAG: hypothetical protein AB4352_27015 [Hormoscilla sp.]
MPRLKMSDRIPMKARSHGVWSCISWYGETSRGGQKPGLDVNSWLLPLYRSKKPGFLSVGYQPLVTTPDRPPDRS